MVNESGEVTLSISYTPWGDTMEVYGTGMLNLGYMGGVYDVGTGLIYMGSGQYYDPRTGRFLTRGAQPEQNNPYTPWNTDPAGMLITPALLLALIYGRKKNKTKFDQFVIVFVLIVSVGFSAVACVPAPTGDPTSEPSEEPTPSTTPTPDPTGTPTTEPSETPIPSSTATDTPTPSICIELYFKPVPDIDNYIPSEEPDNITWDPIVNIDLSPSVPKDTEKAQYKPYYTGLEWKGGNLCGQIAVSMIASTYNGGQDILESIISEFPINGGQTKPHEVLYGAINSLSTVTWVETNKIMSWEGYAHNYDNQFYMNSSMSDYTVGNLLGDAVTVKPWSSTVGPEDVANGSASKYNYGEIADQELLARLSKANPAHIIILTNLERENGTGWRTLTDEGYGHWVVLTGMSSNWNKYDDEFSPYHWVRINNPFNNRYEYYPWRDFKKSISAPGASSYQMVELYIQ